MKKTLGVAGMLLAAFFLLLGSHLALAKPPTSSAYFELRVYHMKTSQQEARIDSFLRQHYLPAMRAQNISHVGVFKPLSNDTAADKKIYVFTPFKSLKHWEQVKANKPSVAETSASDYTSAAHNAPAYQRLETIFLKAFDLMPEVAASKLQGPRPERVYELRSYESASEKLARNKVQMFNQGGEVKLFSRLGFNAVFYGEVVFGAHMPNLMYMTSFDNMAARDQHWKAFGNDPEWKSLSAKSEYQNNVSHIDIIFLRPASYSAL